MGELLWMPYRVSGVRKVSPEFLTAISLEEAKQAALGKVRESVATEEIKTREGLGRVLAVEVTSPIDLPGFTRSTMDGYAVKAADTFKASQEHPVKLRLVGKVTMGEDPSSRQPLRSGEARQIATGGALPPGADTVVVLEETEPLSEEEVAVLSPVAPAANLIAKDEDLRAGQRIFPPGHRLRPQDIGVLLGAGITDITVSTKVSVGIISTGEELIPPHQIPRPGQIRDINSYTLQAQIEQAGATVRLYGIVGDEEERLLELARAALGENDLLLISGGSSVGSCDLTLAVLDQLGEVLIHGIAIAPGKPTIFALADKKPIVGLPGNPVSSVIVCDKFVIPIIAKLEGAREAERRRPNLQAELLKNIPSARGRQEFTRVKLIEKEGRLYAEPLSAKSSLITSLAAADGLVIIPAASEGFTKGERVMVEIW